MTGRPTKYPARRPSPEAASLAMRYQMPSNPAPLEPRPSHDPDPAPAPEGQAEAAGPRPGDERTRLLRRIVEAKVPHRQLCLLLVECEGVAAFSDAALQRMADILDIIETKSEKSE